MALAGPLGGARRSRPPLSLSQGRPLGEPELNSHPPRPPRPPEATPAQACYDPGALLERGPRCRGAPNPKPITLDPIVRERLQPHCGELRGYPRLQAYCKESLRLLLVNVACRDA